MVFYSGYAHRVPRLTPIASSARALAELRLGCIPSMADEDERRRVDAISRPAAVTWLPCAPATTTAAAPDPEPPYREWEDPKCFGVGKEAAHTALFGCESREVALGRGRAGSARYQSLNGAWRFRWAPTVREGLCDEHTR